jgi:hypothetical protein
MIGADVRAIPRVPACGRREGESRPRMGTPRKATNRTAVLMSTDRPRRQLVGIPLALVDHAIARARRSRSWTEEARRMLLFCPECDGKVSSNALTCPHCGNPVPVGDDLDWLEYEDEEEEDEDEADDDGLSKRPGWEFFACEATRAYRVGAGYVDECRLHKWKGSPGYWRCSACGSTVQPPEEFVLCRRKPGALHRWRMGWGDFGGGKWWLVCRRCDMSVEVSPMMHGDP